MPDPLPPPILAVFSAKKDDNSLATSSKYPSIYYMIYIILFISSSKHPSIYYIIYILYYLLVVVSTLLFIILYIYYIIY